MFRRKGFTLIELLVVISVIALLLSILMPSLSRVKASARRIVCSSQLHQVGVAMHLYAAKNDSKLPAVEGTLGEWLFDIPYMAAEFVRNEYAQIELMYCPDNSLRKKNDDELLEYYTSHFYGGVPGDPPEAFNGGWAVTDYFWLMTFGQDSRDNPDEYLYEEGPNQNKKIFVSNTIVKQPSDYPMVVDLVWAQGSPDDEYLDFTTVISAFVFSSNHVEGSKATGGNRLCVDGNVKWTKFDDMYMHYGRAWAPTGNTLHYWK